MIIDSASIPLSQRADMLCPDSYPDGQTLTLEAPSLRLNNSAAYNINLGQPHILHRQIQLLSYICIFKIFFFFF